MQTAGEDRQDENLGQNDQAIGLYHGREQEQNQQQRQTAQPEAAVLH